MRFTSFQQTHLPALPARVVALALIVSAIELSPTFAATATASVSATIIAPDIVQIGTMSTRGQDCDDAFRLERSSARQYWITINVVKTTMPGIAGTSTNVRARSAETRRTIVLNNY